MLEGRGMLWPDVAVRRLRVGLASDAAKGRLFACCAASESGAAHSYQFREIFRIRPSLPRAQPVEGPPNPTVHRSSLESVVHDAP